MKGGPSSLTSDKLVEAGMSWHEADAFMKLVHESGDDDDLQDLWRRVVSMKLLSPHHPHSLHQLVYYSLFSHLTWDSSALDPPLYWFPCLSDSLSTNLGRLMESHGPTLLGNSYLDPISSFSLFHSFSVLNPHIYWSLLIKQLSVRFHQPPTCILDVSDTTKPGGTWFPGSLFNISESCLLPTTHPAKLDNSIAIVWRQEVSDHSPLFHLTFKQLRRQVMLVAHALDSTFAKGDAIAIDLPMTVNAVIIYLAIILSGRIVVSIADSFAANEIATRLRISQAKAIFTQVNSSSFILCRSVVVFIT